MRRLFLFLLVGLVGCTAVPATPTPLSLLPTPNQMAVAPTITPSLTPTVGPSPTVAPTIPTVTFTPSPFAVGSAVFPSQIDVTTTPIPPTQRPDALVSPTPLGTIEWRPPPAAVPLSLHPDDHYWLSRPIPSGSRNYALEWYPFGNDVLIDEYAPYRIHHGLDFPNRDGTQVLASGSGTVVWAGPRPSERDGVNYYGNTIIIRHDWQWQGKDVYTLYAHTIEMFVSVGDFVEQGQLIAGVGGTGFTSGPHLHFEVRVGANQYFAARNPHLWLAPFEGWGTLAGRFVDTQGTLISSADVVVTPLRVSEDTSLRRQKTYADNRLSSSEVWRENFVVGDLPAGTYRVALFLDTITDGVAKYEQVVEVLPSRTNFVIFQADFVFVPTPTPLPTVPLTGTITSTVGITNTIGITGTVEP